jgi:hypothetical protein
MWRLPGAPDKRLFGTLSCNEEGELRLSVLGSFGEGGFLGGMHGGEQLATILGIALKDNTNQEVTLRHCFVLNQSWSSGELGKKQEIFAHRAFFGAHLPADGDFVFESASLSFSGLALWAHNITGFSSDLGQTSITWEFPKPLHGKIPTGTFDLGAGYSYSGTARKKSLTERIGISLRFSTSLSEHDLATKVISPFQNFFTLATDIPNAMTKLTVSRVADAMENIVVVGPTTFTDESVADGLMPYKMLFSLEDVRDRLERVFQRWLEISKRLEKALVVYFACVYNPAGYADLRFQQMMSAVDLYHSANIHDMLHRPTPAEQLLDEISGDLTSEQSAALKTLLASHPLIAAERALLSLLTEHQKEATPLITDKDGRGVDAFLRYALNTISYTLTREHPRGPFAAEGADLHWLTERMAFLIKISLLKELEFSNEQVAEILKRNPQFRHIVDNIRPTTSWTSS